MLTYAQAEAWLLARSLVRKEADMPARVSVGPELYKRLCAEQATDRPKVFEVEVTR